MGARTSRSRNSDDGARSRSPWRLLASVMVLGACGSSPPGPEAAPAKAAPAEGADAAARVVEDGAPSSSTPSSKHDPGDRIEKTPPAGADAALRADLEALCAALNHDYVDGTLTDYYREVHPTTPLGQQWKKAGEESVQPGRALAVAYAEHLARAPGEAPGEGMPACARLFEELDDLE